MIYEILFWGAFLFALGSLFFGRFDERTPLIKRVLKLLLYLGVAALATRLWGRMAGFIWVVGGVLLALSVHVWWCRKHGIGVLSAEPREKYYQLRAWKCPQ